VNNDESVWTGIRGSPRNRLGVPGGIEVFAFVLPGSGLGVDGAIAPR
jgi:hypothetical protein